MGSLVAASLLFGIPLAALGATTPLLVAAQQRSSGHGAGESAGRLFFVNTMGSLLGGWITALGLIPNFSMRVTLMATGAGMVLLAAAWAWKAKRMALAGGAAACVLLAILAAPSPVSSVTIGNNPLQVLWRQQSEAGLVQVIEMPMSGRRMMLLDGVTQGGMSQRLGLTCLQFTANLEYLAWRYNPQAKRALCLGLGTGMLAKALHLRGMEVDVAELAPQVLWAARSFFGLPDAVRVSLVDAREFLRRKGPGYDVIFLDAFAGESAPWYLETREALATIRQRLNPGGLLLANTVTQREGKSAGQARLEAALADGFKQVDGFLTLEEGTAELVNATYVAGQALQMQSQGRYPGVLDQGFEGKLVNLEKTRFSAVASPGLVGTDDYSDLDHADAKLRIKWRELVLKDLGSQILAD
jgi:spermidine synthase